MIVEDNEINRQLIEQISYISTNMYMEFFDKYQNVVGLGVGQKTINCIDTGIPCLTVFVTKKLPENCLYQNQIIPQTYNGFLVDILEAGELNLKKAFTKKYKCYTSCNKESKNHKNCSCLKPCNGNSCNCNPNLGKNTDKFRPADGGVGISTFNDIYEDTGTLGIGVADASNIYVLSCNHVLSDFGNLPIGTPIVQPSAEFGGNLSDRIANLSRFVPIYPVTPTTSPQNLVDAAIAIVGPKSNQTIISQTILKPGLHDGTKITGIYLPNIGEIVFKIGAITGLTNTKIISLHTTLRLNAEGHQYIYINQITTENRSRPGDSGAIGFDGSRSRAFGLLSASIIPFDYYNPIDAVLQAFNVNFWNM